MSLKKIIGIIGGVALLASAAGGLHSAPANRLENLVAQEAVQQQAVQVDEQKYAEIKGLFEENDAVARGIVEKAAIEYNPQYKSICTVYYLKDVNIYKYNKAVLKESKRWGKTDSLTDTFTPASMPLVYVGVKPGTEIPAEVKDSAAKASITEPIFDDKTLDMKINDDLLVFALNPERRTKASLVSYVPMGDPANLAAFKKVLEEKKITDNYGIK